LTLCQGFFEICLATLLKNRFHRAADETVPEDDQKAGKGLGKV